MGLESLRLTAAVRVTVVPLPIRLSDAARAHPQAQRPFLDVEVSNVSRERLEDAAHSCEEAPELLAQGSDLRLIGGCDWDRE